MSSLLLLTNALQPSTEVLPALGLLLHNVRVAPAEGPALVDTPGADVILIDGRRDLPQVRSLCQLLRSTGPGCPLVLVVTEGGLAAVTADWGIDDVLLDTAGPAEVEARLRLAMGRQQIVNDDSPMEIRNGDLSVDEATYSAKLKGRVLDLTFKEFELLKYLAQHPGRVFTRAQLLQEVWGYDYFGGTRTVDVHVRRLRAKLGPEHESLIGTVRNVGYRFVTPEKVERAAGGTSRSSEAESGGEAKAKAVRPKPEDADETAHLDAAGAAKASAPAPAKAQEEAVRPAQR
ncbi:response regulator transcription factor [Streptomyces ortus]|uniref:Response regulator transcription factor n=1 Tax=Streptomyces ortus TaxID=2867268 RepID=A0ABT3V5H9_9ACTN|nr:response regulator transcription factor [Streptomyces ortus]MCX4235229.1 response regulator transcription factor [Streptomyces ortus]